MSDHHRVLAEDLPGHGRVEGPFTLDRAVESVRKAIDQAGGKAHVVGIFGGALDLRSRLGQVAVPTLVLCGSKDRPNIPLSSEIAAAIPGAKLRIVADAAHLWNLQQPETFNLTVAEFVDQAACGA